MRRNGLFAIRAAAVLLALSMPAFAQDEGRGIGTAIAGPAFHLPAGVSVERQDVHISIYSVRLTYVFKSATRQTVHFSFAMPEMPVDAAEDLARSIRTRKPRGWPPIRSRPTMRLSRQRGRPAVDMAAADGRCSTAGRRRQLLDAGVPLLSGFDGGRSDLVTAAGSRQSSGRAA